jgi:hypothetical protein
MLPPPYLMIIKRTLENREILLTSFQETSKRNWINWQEFGGTFAAPLRVFGMKWRFP